MAHFTKLKIGLVFDDTLDNPDGVQQYILAIGEWLTAQGHEVRYLVGATKRAEERSDIYSLSRNLGVRFNKNRLSVPLPANREAIKRVLDNEHFDVLHVQLPCSPMMAGRIVSLAPPETTIVGTFHIVGYNWLANQGAKLLGIWQRKMFQRFDHIVCVSDAARDYAIKHFGIEDCSVLPNVITASRFVGAKPLPHLEDGKVNIMFLGRLVERKGCHYLIEAVRRLRDRGALDNTRVLICGKGPLEGKLKQLVRRYKLQDHVTFVGFLPEEDKASYLASADFVIYPSTGGESFGIVILEAMAASKGVVMGGNNEGYRTVLGPQANHLLFNPRNTQVFADKIQLLMRNPALCKRLHDWQVKEVVKYDVETVGPKLLEMYL